MIPSYTRVTATQAASLAQPVSELYPVKVALPYDREAPATLSGVVQAVTEVQTGLGGVHNQSHTFAFEIRRPTPEELRVQFVFPRARLGRKARLALKTHVPTASVSDGTSGLPIHADDSLGGGFLRPRRPDWVPVKTSFTSPPTNHLIAALHPDAMPDTRFVVQVLVQPVAGRSLRQWRWQCQARQRARFLRQRRNENKTSSARSQVARETAHAIDEKRTSRRFWTAIRIVIIGANKATRARLTELKGAFNHYETPTPRQYFEAIPLRSLQTKRFLRFGRAVAHLSFAESLRFQATTEEVGAFIAIPTNDQRNLEVGKP